MAENNSDFMIDNMRRRYGFNGLAIDKAMKILEEKTTSDNAADFGEIRGLYTAYKLSPSDLLLEAIIVKCLEIILNNEENVRSLCSTAIPNAREKIPAVLKNEWAEGFLFFLTTRLIKSTTENTAGVYIRAIKRVMKNDLNTDNIEVLIERIDEMIAKYDGNDAESHNVHISALRRFKDFIEDDCGYLIVLEYNGKIEVADRLPCSLDKAMSSLELEREEYAERGIDVVLYDKFGRPVMCY